MGTALDAQGRHQDAEVAFREGVDNWQGDPAPILNNLALNLASQGRLEQSLEILRKAKKISPHRIEIERNLRIISTLQETAGPTPPAPRIKPEPKETTLEEEAPIPSKKKASEETITDKSDTVKEIIEEEKDGKPAKAILKHRPLND
jgi:Flp pilus assembly protein TadD